MLLKYRDYRKSVGNIQNNIGFELLNTNHTKKELFENIAKIYLLTEEDKPKKLKKYIQPFIIRSKSYCAWLYWAVFGIYARHLQLFVIRMRVVIYQSSSDLAWLSSKIRDIIKAPGWDRHTPFKKVVMGNQAYSG